MKLLYAVILMLTLTACAGMSKSFSDNEDRYRRGIKVTMIVATEKAIDKKAFAIKVNTFADKAIALLGKDSLSKTVLLDFLRNKAASSEASIGVKIVLDDIILTAEELLAGVVPDADIPSEYKEQLKKIAEYVKNSIRFYL